MLYQMGHQDYSVYVNAFRVEDVITEIIKRVIVTSLAPLRDKMRYNKLEIDTITIRVATCDQTGGSLD